MARGFRMGVGGGAKPKQIFLYNKGVDNTALTGGLSSNGYTYQSDWNMAGNVFFESDYIIIRQPDVDKYATAVGTTNKVDLTNIKAIIIKGRKPDNTAFTATMDVSSLNDSYYISVFNCKSATSVRFAVGFVTTSKTNCGQGQYSATTGQITYGSGVDVIIDSIELIPYDEPIVQTILGDLTGTYAGLATKTSAIEVPTIQSGQKLRLVGHNNVSTTYNYQINVAFSTDGTNWVTIYTSSTIPFPTSGAITTLNIDVSNVFGNRGYFRVFISGDSRSSNTITSAILGIFRD